jgi:hypothetical protein
MMGTGPIDRIIATAAMTGKATCEIGTIIFKSNTERNTWKLNGKQISFENLYSRLNKAIH